MFLRSLYGSRMPQALYPRVDPQASSYWEEDTSSSREIARAIEEADALGTEPMDDGKKKSSVLTAAALAGDEHASGRHSVTTLSSHVASVLELNEMALEDVEGMRIEDMDLSPVSAQLSPTGLISIAAADVDEAATNNLHNVPPVNGELDLAFIHSLRRASSESNTDVNACNPSHVVNAALTQLLGSLPASCRPTSDASVTNAETVESGNKLFSLIRRHANMLGFTLSLLEGSAYEIGNDEAEGHSRLRFLLLLRRINELRSQQVNNESWDGLPYPQIIALPTFEYQIREQLDAENKTDDDSEVNNAVCTVCCDEFKTGEEVRALPCLHFYHRECIDQWLMCHRQCPICKHVVAVK